jgi:glycerol-3-phosphate acyltransferase PlsY
MGKLLLVVFAYLLGSILFGDIVARIKGVNLREIGSGNVGATNVSRALGKKFGVLVFLLDMLKGFIPTALALSLYGIKSKVVMFVGVASVLGHMFSVFDRFRGGKGVATAFGVVLALSYKLALILFLVWVAVLFWKRYVSLASISASVSAPLVFLLAGYPFHIVLMGVFIGVLIVYKHKDNIDRILSGREPKV